MNLLNLIIYTTITKFMKRHITNSMRDYSQCFMTIIAYNLIIKTAMSSRTSVEPIIELVIYILNERIDWMNECLK